MRELFYQAQGLIAEEELQVGEHRFNPSVDTAILLSPLTEPEHFYNLHHHYSKEHFNTTKVATKRLRAHMIQTAEKGAQSNSLLHTSPKKGDSIKSMPTIQDYLMKQKINREVLMPNVNTLYG